MYKTKNNLFCPKKDQESKSTNSYSASHPVTKNHFVHSLVVEEAWAALKPANWTFSWPAHGPFFI